MKNKSQSLACILATSLLLASCGGGGGDSGSAGAGTPPVAATPPAAPPATGTPAPAPSGTATLKSALPDGALSYYGQVLTNTNSKRITISNTGTGPALLKSFSSTTADFATAPPSQGDCVAGSSLAAGSSCTLNVVMAAQSYGIKNSQIVIDTDASSGKLQVPITGIGYPKAPVAAPSAKVVQLGSSYDPATRTMTIDVRNDCVGDAARIFNVQRWSYYRSTGLYAPPNTDVAISVGGIPAGTDVKAVVGLWQQPTGVTTPAEVDVTEFPLAANSATVIRSTYGGPIYLRATNNVNPSGSVTFTVGSAAKEMPTLFLGRTTFAQWVGQLNSANATPYAEVVTKRTIITFNTNKIKDVLAADPNAEMTLTAGLFDEMLASHDYVAGLDGSTSFNANQQQPLHYTPHQRANAYMFATYYRTAFCYECATFLFTNNFVVDGWGPWHETGHMYQGGWEWPDLSEVSVNLYSLEFERRVGRQHRLILDPGTQPNLNRWDSALKVRSTNLAKFDDLEVFERLVPFEMLTLKFGRDFFGKLNQYYRNPTTRPANIGNQDSMFNASLAEPRRQAFIVAASKVSGTDLREFFKAWALLPDAATDATIAALGLPKVDVNSMLGLRPQ